MKPKKNPKVDLEKKRGLFLQIGLVLSLLIVIVSFQYRSYEKVISLGELDITFEHEEEIANTFRKEKVVSPPPPKTIEIIPNEKDIIIIEACPSYEPDLDIGIIDEPEENVDDKIFMAVEDMPRFEGCTDETCTQTKIMQFIAKKTKYPPIAKENNITGRVFVSFVVDKIGKVTNVKILRGVDKYLDAEAVRVVSSLPKFKPGKQRGKPVKVQYNVPISFKLD